jgi:membrane protein implicated in regulation of membrane protease activity
MQELLRQPEYLHVLINPLPVYGLTLGTLALIAALIARSRAASVSALAIVFVSAISVWPTSEFGEQGEDRVESMSDRAGYEWLEEHKERAEKAEPFHYAAAVLALGALLVPWKFPRSALPLSILTVLFSSVALGLGSWAAYAGGKIRHKEFRTGPLPQRAEKTHAED